MNLALFCTLILCVFGNEVRINISLIPNQIQHNNHFSSINLGRDQLKVSDQKKYLDDYTLTIPLTLGQNTVEQVIDTTSYISWVYGDKNGCQGCPQQATNLKCEGDCQPLKKDNVNVQLNDEITFGGRIKVEGQYGQQDSVELMGLKVNKIGLGVINKITADSTQISKQGALGLAYGSKYIEYKNKKNAQVGTVELQNQMEPQNSLLQQLNAQLSNVPTSTFAIKLEDNLQMLIIGEEQSYFAKNKLNEFSNVGERVWALKINKMSLIDKSFLSKGTAVFDSTTRFIWTEQTVIDKLKEQFSNIHIECENVDGLLKCPCNDEQFGKIGDINFSFNLNTQTNFPISKEDYIQRDNGQCYILIKKLVETNTIESQQEKPIVIIPHTFYKKNYVLFNQNENTISISEAYNVQSDSLHLDNNTLIYTSLIGGALIILALIILVNCMQKAPYDPNYTHTINQNVKQTQIPQYIPPPVYQPYSPQRIQQQQYGYQMQPPPQQPYQGGLFSPYRGNQVIYR